MGIILKGFWLDASIILSLSLENFKTPGGHWEGQSHSLAAITVVGRLISGVHWFTDIIGGILISSGLLMTFYSLLSIINKENY